MKVTKGLQIGAFACTVVGMFEATVTNDPVTGMFWAVVLLALISARG